MVVVDGRIKYRRVSSYASSLRGASATKQSSLLKCSSLDCFAEPVIGRRFAPTRWLAMTANSSMLPRAHIAEQEPRHFALLDFLAAFGDAVAAVVAIDVLERLVA
jgi:hypothetical protein